MSQNQQQALIFGKPYFRLCGGVLFASGVAVIIAGALATHYSGGNYLGGVYSGVLTVFLASSLLQVEMYKSLFSLSMWAGGNLIVSIVALGITSANQEFLDSLEACATYSTSLQTSCTATPSYVECTGNSDYYGQAYACELTYAADNDYEIEDNQCSCVTNDDSDTCYNYYHVSSCSDFLNLVPGQVGAALTFLTIILIANMVVMVLVIINRWKPEMVRTNQERAEMEEVVVPVTIATATLTNSPMVSVAPTTPIIVHATVTSTTNKV